MSLVSGPIGKPGCHVVRLLLDMRDPMRGSRVGGEMEDL
jgi:hypothetical protein